MKYSKDNPHDLTHDELEKVEARKERLERKARAEGLTDERVRAQSEQVFQGVTQWEKGRARRAEWQESMRDKQDRFREDIGVAIPEDAFKDIPPIVKRTPQERLESLTKRLVRARKEGNQAVVETLLGQVQTELFAMTGYRLGEQIAMEDLRALSAIFLNRAEREARNKGAK
jgi:hypothetical protein